MAGGIFAGINPMEEEKNNLIVAERLETATMEKSGTGPVSSAVFLIVAV